MERIPKEGIKDWFKTGDRPTEEEFIDVLPLLQWWEYVKVVEV